MPIALIKNPSIPAHHCMIHAGSREYFLEVGNRDRAPTWLVDLKELINELPECKGNEVVVSLAPNLFSAVLDAPLDEESFVLPRCECCGEYVSGVVVAAARKKTRKCSFRLRT